MWTGAGLTSPLGRFIACVRLVRPNDACECVRVLGGCHFRHRLVCAREPGGLAAGTTDRAARRAQRGLFDRV